MRKKGTSTVVFVTASKPKKASEDSRINPAYLPKPKKASAKKAPAKKAPAKKPATKKAPAKKRDPLLTAQRKKARELALEARELARLKKQKATEKKQGCLSARDEAKRVVAEVRAKARLACEPSEEVEKIASKVGELRGTVQQLKASDPRTKKERQRRERFLEQLEMQAENLPEKARAAFVSAAKHGKIRTSKGNPPKALWERFQEMVQEDPSLLRQRQRTERLEVQHARHELERAESEGRDEDALELRAFIADPTAYDRATRKEQRALQALQRARAERAQLLNPLPIPF